MAEHRARHGSWLSLFLVLVTVFAGCEMPQSGGGGTAGTTSGSSQSEAERTRKIEAKAAEIERHAQEIQNMTGTEQEKIDAVNQLEKERQELQEMQDAK